MNQEELLEVSKLLLELRWITATVTSFLPQDSKEWKAMKRKVDRIGTLSAKCEEKALSLLG